MVPKTERKGKAIIITIPTIIDHRNPMRLTMMPFSKAPKKEPAMPAAPSADCHMPWMTYEPSGCSTPNCSLNAGYA